MIYDSSNILFPVISYQGNTYLTHWGRVTHICVGNLTIIGSDNGLSPGRHQAIIWTNAGMLLSRPLGTNFNEILIEILTFSFMKMRLKVSSAKWRPFYLGLNVLIHKLLFNNRKMLSNSGKRTHQAAIVSLRKSHSGYRFYTRCTNDVICLVQSCCDNWKLHHDIFVPGDW